MLRLRNRVLPTLPVPPPPTGAQPMQLPLTFITVKRATMCNKVNKASQNERRLTMCSRAGLVRQVDRCRVHVGICHISSISCTSVLQLVATDRRDGPHVERIVQQHLNDRQNGVVVSVHHLHCLLTASDNTTTSQLQPTHCYEYELSMGSDVSAGQ